MDDVIRLMDHLGIRKAHVAGYSLGGRIVTMLLANHPDRLLTATMGGTGWIDQADSRARCGLMNQLADSLERGGGAESLLAELARGQPGPSPAQIDSFNKIFLQANDPLALAAVARGANRTFLLCVDTAGAVLVIGVRVEIESFLSLPFRTNGSEEAQQRSERPPS